MSGIDRPYASVVETQPEIATGPDGQRLVVKELVVLINLQKRGSSKPGQVVIMGLAGGLLPAVSASRMYIIEALRTS